MSTQVITVGQLNLYVKSLLESDANLRRITVRGEISNFTRNIRSGHAYFTLKDETSAVRVVMFSSYMNRVAFTPRDGMRVLVNGKINLYEAAGQYQITADSLTRDGIGEAYLAFMQLKEKLAAEGLFAQEYKKNLPVLPKRIGVITSATGAALQDIISVSTRRFSDVCLLVKPASVQGEYCAPSVLGALSYFNTVCPVDVIIIARGGGSYEDLSGFNDERLARAVFLSHIPVVSAVGHETDFTILDFVADTRAPTPSAAAELVVPVYGDLTAEVSSLSERCFDAITARIQSETVRLKNNGYRMNLGEMIKRRETEFCAVTHKIRSAYTNLCALQTQRLQALAEKIQSLSPLSTLLRGFSITYKNSHAVTSVFDVRQGDNLTIRVKDGEIYGVAKEIHEI